jgi:hypothetical protein
MLEDTVLLDLVSFLCITVKQAGGTMAGESTGLVQWHLPNDVVSGNTSSAGAEDSGEGII